NAPARCRGPTRRGARGESGCSGWHRAAGCGRTETPQTTPMNPTPTEFVRALERHLRSHFIPFTRQDVIVFVESCWPLVEDNPHLVHWCQAFRERPASTG